MDRQDTAQGQREFAMMSLYSPRYDHRGTGCFPDGDSTSFSRLD